jgi:hypothetical protein
VTILCFTIYCLCPTCMYSSFSFDIFEVSRLITPNIAYFVPRNANVEQVSDY